MSTNRDRWYWAAGIVPIVAAIYYLISLIAVYSRLPREVPVHFDLDGTLNNTMHKAAWLVLSPFLPALMLLLVYATRPPFYATAIACWCASGLVTGVCFAINRAAVSGGRLRYLPLLAWLAATPACELLWLSSRSGAGGRERCSAGLQTGCSVGLQPHTSSRRDERKLAQEKRSGTRSRRLAQEAPQGRRNRTTNVLERFRFKC